MPIARSNQHPVFEPEGTEGVVVTSLVAPSLGATDTTLYRISMSSGSSLLAHRHDREEAFVILSGSISSVQDGRTSTAGAGDAVWIPAGVEHVALAGSAGAELLVAVPAGTKTLMPDRDPLVAPWGR